MNASVQSRLASELGALDGERIPGGCDFCEAYQTVTPVVSGVWNITVHHDEWCPWFVKRQEHEQ